MCASIGAAAFVTFAACNSDRTTSPLSSPVPDRAASHTIVTTIGTYSIGIPANTNINDGAQPVANTGIIIPAGTYYRVRVNGSTTVTRNQIFQDSIAPYFTFPLVGTYGPGGADGWSSLRVIVKARNTNGSGTNNINLPNLSFGTAAPDSARSDIAQAGQQIEIQAGRNGLACSGNNNRGFTAGCYLLSASQTVTVEAITNIIHEVANPAAVHPNQTVTFTASRDDGGALNISTWYWQPDAVPWQKLIHDDGPPETARHLH